MVDQDQLKRDIEVLRGLPIYVYGGNAADIPCVETSDSSRLCRKPIVSISMPTFNHEMYIRQAIEGVMMQKTDFEFELVIGEDCSTDKTREICLAYQKRYPNKIRVLLSERNLYQNLHPGGGNWEFILAHCRGEFIAFCEGDDYWTDPCKLQKQVDIMRKHPSVTLCFCGSRTYHQTVNLYSDWNCDDAFEPGLMDGEYFIVRHTFGRNPKELTGSERFIMTATTMMRSSAYAKMLDRYSIFRWRLALSDTTTWIGLASLGDVYFIKDQVSVYRQVTTGACNSNGLLVRLDSVLVRMYYAKLLWGIEPWQFTSPMLDSAISALATLSSRSEFRFAGIRRLKTLLSRGQVRLLINPRMWLYYVIMLFGLDGRFVDRVICSYRLHVPIFHVSNAVSKLYRK